MFQQMRKLQRQEMAQTHDVSRKQSSASCDLDRIKFRKRNFFLLMKSTMEHWKTFFLVSNRNPTDEPTQSGVLREEGTTPIVCRKI
jgi:hypothetical protein